MSAATKCDVCGGFYESPAFGAVTIESMHVDTGDEEGTCASWPEVDLCATCARPLLKLLKPALNGLDDKYIDEGG